MQAFKRPHLRTALVNSLNLKRALATPSSAGPSSSVSPTPTPRSEFRQNLASGPSLDDFITDNVPDRIVLGNTKG